MSTPLKKSTPISKSLLTPCRRVGLSRIRKTPDSIAKLMKLTPGESSGTPSDSPKTPASAKHKEALKPPLNSPLAELLPTSPLVVKSDLLPKTKGTLLGKSGVRKAAKKSLGQKFAKECSDNSEEVDIKKQVKDEPIKREDCTVTELPISPAVCEAKSSKSGAETVPELSLDEDNDSFVNIRKKKTRVLSDDNLSNSASDICETETNLTFESTKKGVLEKDFSVISNVETNTCNKTVTDHSTAEKEDVITIIKNRQLPSDDNSSNVGTEICVKIRKSPKVEGIKKRKTRIPSEDYIPEMSDTCKRTLETATKHPSVDDDDFIIIKRKNKRRLSDDDFTAVSNSQKSVDSDEGKQPKKSKTKTDKSSKKKISIRQSLGEDGDDDFVTTKRERSEESGNYVISSQSSKQEVSHIGVKNFRVELKQLSKEEIAQHQTPEQLKENIPVILKDDDVFISTSKEEQSEREDLLSNIRALELKIKEKKKTLEDLKRAATYKNKHNIDELEQLVEVWRKGCVAGLMALQEKLQAHSPISMETLLCNLHIPNEIAKTKLKIQ